MLKPREVIVSCPKCKTFETLWFRGEVMERARKFEQRSDGQVYHIHRSCGSEIPCKLYPRFLGERWI